MFLGAVFGNFSLHPCHGNNSPFTSCKESVFINIYPVGCFTGIGCVGEGVEKYLVNTESGHFAEHF
jgi:hypothetical protein